MDLLGVMVVAVITAIGGGTVRDVLLDSREAAGAGSEVTRGGGAGKPRPRNGLPGGF